MKTQRDCNIDWVGRMVQERLRRVGHRDGRLTHGTANDGGPLFIV
jgi:hypothetical protein